MKYTTSLISPLSIAPMIDWTNTHFRMFMRILAPKALLYTEMQTPGGILNNPNRTIGFQHIEKPLALQLGGSDVQALVNCAIQAEQAGFDEINLNLGCPSDRVQAGRFGACMMAEADLVSKCIIAMKRSVSIPVTAKTRIGIDEQDSYEFFSKFAHRLVDAGCHKLIVHARKAWLRGLSPKQNRTIPPLHYDYVYQIKQDLPSIPVVINGHINTIDMIHEHTKKVDGVMVGRLACQNPYSIAVIHHALYPDVPLIKRSEAVERYMDYASAMSESGVSWSVLMKPILNIGNGLSGSKRWKRLVGNRESFTAGILQEFIESMN